jgi:hypothetical protein
MARCLVVDVAIFLDERDRPGRELPSLGAQTKRTLENFGGVVEGSRTVETHRFVETLCRARKCLVDERRHFTSLCRRRGCSDEARMN